MRWRYSMRQSLVCRIFVGDLGNEVNDDVLQKSFQKFTSFQKGKVVRDKRTNKTKGGLSCRAPGPLLCFSACATEVKDPFMATLTAVTHS